MDVLKAIAQRLKGIRGPVIIGEPDTHENAPYIFVWAHAPLPVAHDLADSVSDIDDEFGITCVAQTTNNCVRMQQEIVSRLDRCPITAKGYGQGRITIVDTQPARHDRTVADTESNAYPVYAVTIVHIRLPKE